jgi:hypothetical protein
MVGSADVDFSQIRRLGSADLVTRFALRGVAFKAAAPTFLRA